MKKLPQKLRDKLAARTQSPMTITVQCQTCRRFAEVIRQANGMIRWPGGCPCLAGVSFGTSTLWRTEKDEGESYSIRKHELTER